MDETNPRSRSSRRANAFLFGCAWACWAPVFAHAQPADTPEVSESAIPEREGSATLETALPGAPRETASLDQGSAPAPPPDAPSATVPFPVEAAAPPPAPDASGWAPVFTGSYFTRYEMRANYDDMGVSRARFLEGDGVFYRARLGIGTGLIDVGDDLKVALQFTPQATGVFGTLATNAIADAALGLHEAYLRVKGKYVQADAGRFEMNYGDAFMIGNLDWHQLGRSFDGARARIASSPSSAWLDLFVTLLDDGYSRPPSGFGRGDLFFYGIYAALGPALVPGLDFDLYALGRGFRAEPGLRESPADPASPTYRREGANELTFGARVKQKIGMFDYRAEAGLQTGSRPGAVPTAAMSPPASAQAAVDAMAYQVDAELGLHLADGRFRLGVEGLYASGDDPDTKDRNEGWDELYPTAHKWLGFADVFTIGAIKRTNVLSGVGHLLYKPAARLALQADGHLFSRPENVAPTLGGNRGFAGAEIDVGAVYTLGKGLKARALYAVFLPDKDFYPINPASPLAGQVDPIHYLEVELRYDL